VRIISGVKEAENVKLVKQGGANVIVSPSKVGGYMLADAIDRAYTVDYLYDLMTAGGDINLVERPVRADEIGQMARAVAEGLVLGVQRAGQKINFWDLPQTPLRDGDVLLVITRSGAAADT
jgi:voltage-gated potassium channel